MVRVGYMDYFQDYEWYDNLMDDNLKEEALKQKAINERSWGDATQRVMNFCSWLKRCFENFYELDYELLYGQEIAQRNGDLLSMVRSRDYNSDLLTGVLLTLWPRLNGFVICFVSYILLYRLPPLSTVITEGQANPLGLRENYIRCAGGSVTGREGGDRTDSVTGPSLQTIGPSARFVVLFDSSHHSGIKSAYPEVDSLVRSAAPVMTEAITVATVATTVTIPADISKDKSAPHLSIFGSSSSSEKTDHTLSLFTRRSGSGFDVGSIRAEEVIGAGLEEVYVPEWTVTKGFEMNDGRLCANMIDHFTPPALLNTDHTARNLSLSSEVRMRAEYNILEKRKWRSLAEEKNILLEAKDKEIEDLKTRLAEIDADFTPMFACAFRRVSNPHDSQRVCGAKEGLLTHGNKLLVVKFLIPNEVTVEAPLDMHLDDFNSAIRDLNFPLLQELSDKMDSPFLFGRHRA
ncbi:hypothetical protein Tco_0492633 [Tanacetum coccineum]